MVIYEKGDIKIEESKYTYSRTYNVKVKGYLVFYTYTQTEEESISVETLLKKARNLVRNQISTRRRKLCERQEYLHRSIKAYPTFTVSSWTARTIKNLTQNIESLEETLKVFETS
jgi:hypothetical protein